MTAPIPPPHVARAPASRARTIITAEGLALNFTLASRGARLGALILDWLIIAVIIVAVTVTLGFTAAGLGKINGISHHLDTNAPAGFVVVWLAALFVLRNGWFLLFELGPRGATPGKRVLGIRIAARGGARLGPTRVIARNLLRDVEIFAPWALIGIFGEGAGVVMAVSWFLAVTCLPFWNRDALRAGDLIGGTWVVEAPRTALAPLLVAPPTAAQPHTYRFGEAELSTYGEYELQTLERVLREGRGEAMLAVAEAICARIGWTPPDEPGARAFLTDYYTQLRARLEAGMRLGRRRADKFAGQGGIL